MDKKIKFTALIILFLFSAAFAQTDSTTVISHGRLLGGYIVYTTDPRINFINFDIRKSYRDAGGNSMGYAWEAGFHLPMPLPYFKIGPEYGYKDKLFLDVHGGVTMPFFMGRFRPVLFLGGVALYRHNFGGHISLEIEAGSNFMPENINAAIPYILIGLSSSK